jgi:hypothetical protein
MSVNAECIRARHLDSNFSGSNGKATHRGSGAIKPSEITTPKPGAGQSERFSDIGAARRGLGAVCCPAAV